VTGGTGRDPDEGRTVRWSRTGQAPEPGPAIATLLRRFRATRVVVVGDSIFDAYLEGTATRLCREGPVPVVSISERREAAGGAANVAVNCSALGARVELCSVVGDDEAGARVLEIARDHGVGLDGVVVAPARTTPAKRRILANGHLLARFDEGTEHALGPAEAASLCAVLAPACARADVTIVSDYGLGVLSDVVLEALARCSGAPLVVDGRDPRRLRAVRPAICAPSFDDVAPLIGAARNDRGNRPGAVAAARDQLLAETGAAVVVVTLDRDGAVVLEHDAEPQQVAGHALRERCAAGAGDTFTAALALASAAGAPSSVAAAVAAAAAAVVVGKPSTATCSPTELRARMRSTPQAAGGHASLDGGAGGRFRQTVPR
jgi:D-beta-D-heptose 7-phosphate kinase/D-beta-D-heptose 1-phosphate adenosyltransferase